MPAHPVSRMLLYLAAAPLVLVIAFVLGATWYESTECGAGADECEIASVAGVVWAAGGLAIWLLASLVTEVVVSSRRARSA